MVITMRFLYVHALMLMCMHTIFLYAMAHIFAQLDKIREIWVSIEMGGRVSQHHNTFACVSNHAYMLVCMYSKFVRAQADILSHLGKTQI